MRRHSYKTDPKQALLFEPESEWIPPQSFPNTDICRYVSIDTETCDPYIKTHGCGASRGRGYPVGISLTTDTGFTGYFPFKHEGGGNFPTDSVVQFFRDLLKRTNLVVIFCNALYDLEMLRSIDIHVNGQIHDIQVAEGLIDEESESGYSLNALSKKYGLVSKDENVLRAAARAYGIDPKSELYKLHSRYVGKYAEVDAYNTYKIWEQQQKIIEVEELEEVYSLECALIPLLLEMRYVGVPFSEEACVKAMQVILEAENSMMRTFKDEYNAVFNPWSNGELAHVCEQNRIWFPQTAKGSPSFTKEFLEVSNVPLLNLVREYRVANRLRKTFLENTLDKFVFDGRIYTQFHATRHHDDKTDSDEGTRQRRFSSTKPNLQQIPNSKKSQYGHLVRACFVPDKGYKWLKCDYSQQEPRLALHFAYKASCNGAAEGRERYLLDNNTDFYNYMVDLVEVDRSTAKMLTLAKMYRLTAEGYSKKMGIAVEDARNILGKLDAEMPWMSEVSDLAMRTASVRGFVRTLLGARRRFDKWTSRSYWQIYEDTGSFPEPMSKQAAEALYGSNNIIRFGARKALNSVVQGSGGDITKQALLDVWQQTKIVPYMTVHDEIDMPCEDEATASKVKKIMEEALKDRLSVPMKVDAELIDHWK